MDSRKLFTDKIPEPEALPNTQKTFNMKEIIDHVNALVRDYKNVPCQLPKPLTIPKIFNKTYDENFISDFLSYILNPFENGVGFGPLNALLNFSQNNEKIQLDNSLSKRDISIRREHPFEDRKRIDLRITIRDELVICIENKILMSEGKYQTKNYAESIKKEFPGYNYIFLYLSPTKNIAPSSDEFIHISYSDLIERLEPIGNTSFHLDRKRLLFKEFILHIKEYIMDAKTLYLSEKSKLYLKYKDVIDDLSQSFKNNSDDHFEYCMEIIKSIYTKEEEEWEFNFTADRVYQQVFKKNWPRNKNLNIHFEYNFPEKSLLIKQKIGFMLDVEGQKKREFRDEYQKVFGRIENNYHNNEIKYLPGRNDRSIAYKNYDFAISPDNPDSRQIADFFQKAFDEFSFIIPMIDEVLDKKNIEW
jgi:hypothetical protein